MGFKNSKNHFKYRGKKKESSDQEVVPAGKVAQGTAGDIAWFPLCSPSKVSAACKTRQDPLKRHKGLYFVQRSHTHPTGMLLQQDTHSHSLNTTATTSLL